MEIPAKLDIQEIAIARMLEEHLTNNNYTSAVALVSADDKYMKDLNYNFADILNVIMKFLTIENHTLNPDLYLVCEKILKIVIEKTTSGSRLDECLFEFVELMEQTLDDNIFISILKPLQLLLIKAMNLKNYRVISLDIVCDAILTYIHDRLQLESIGNHVDDENVQKLMEENDSVKRLLSFLMTVHFFYEPIILEILKVRDQTGIVGNQNNTESPFHFNGLTNENVITCFLIQLLNKPFALLNLVNEDDRTFTNTYSRQCARQIISSIGQFTSDPYRFLEITERLKRWSIKYNDRKSKKPKFDDDLRNVAFDEDVQDMTRLNIFCLPDRINILSIGVYYYLIFVEGLMPNEAPKIYTNNYIFEMTLYIIVDLFTNISDGSIHLKAIRLATVLIDKLASTEESKFDISVFHLSIYKDFLDKLLCVIAETKIKSISKLGTELFKKFFFQFRIDAQYFLFKYLFETLKHNGLYGLLITYYKNCLATELSTEPDKPHKYFTNEYLHNFLLKYIFYLKDGPTTDLLEFADSIISALNLLIFLSIRDRENRTKFWNIIDTIENRYLKPLEKGLYLTKSHYKQNLQEIMDDKLNKNRAQDDDDHHSSNDVTQIVDIYLDGNKFELNDQFKIHSCLISINTLDDIERVQLARLISSLTTNNPCSISASVVSDNYGQRYSNSIILKNQLGVKLIQTINERHLSINRTYSNSGAPNRNDTTNTNDCEAQQKQTLENTVTPENIDAFRAREEKREEDFSRQHQSDQHYEAAQENLNNEKIQLLRTKILDSSLEFVNEYGWTREAIVNGAKAVGYPSVVHGLFPKGGIELIQYFYAKSNEELVRKLLKDYTDRIESKESVPSISPAEFVHKALKCRLQMIEPYIKTWPQAIAIMSLPPNVPTTLAQLLTLVDDICFYTGDRSVDFGWYTRRIGLAAIYKMTELYMLQDSSIEHKDTWNFLERRIEDGIQFQAVFNLTDQRTRNMTQALNSVFLTARNILGLNRR